MKIKKQYQSGNSKVLGWFVGQVMKETKGQANPSVVNKVIIDKLKITFYETSKIISV